jgi:hypothetical protein
MLAPLAEVRSARWIVAVAAVIVVWAVAMAQWIVGDLVVPWDSKNQFYAFFRPAGAHRVVFSFRPLSPKNLAAAFGIMLGATVR